MSEAQFVFNGSKRLMEYYATAPTLGDIFAACMWLQPEIDPGAGYGVFQAMYLYEQAALTLSQGQKCLALLDYSPIKTYLLFRGLYGLAVDKQEIFDFIEDKVEFDFEDIARFLGRQFREFNVDFALKELSRAAT